MRSTSVLAALETRRSKMNGYDDKGRPIDLCACNQKFIDAEDYRDHLPCSAVKWEKEATVSKQTEASEAADMNDELILDGDTSGDTVSPDNTYNLITEYERQDIARIVARLTITQRNLAEADLVLAQVSETKKQARKQCRAVLTALNERVDELRSKYGKDKTFVINPDTGEWVK